MPHGTDHRARPAVTTRVSSVPLLYALMFAPPLVGWGMLYAALRKTHIIFADLLFLTFIAHFGAILFHTLIARDRIFSRMAPWKVG
ncbi:MAG TPA: cytochrome b/b6 domain-containing protein [Tepidisphaeraceae bacterium]|nr:cytochrome b/b6 domain-containing protein [Tepidisphaeraceae bacterium]